MSAYLYILHCADGSYYIGTTVGSLERRVAEHQTGAHDGYTSLRRPVTLVFHQHFDDLMTLLRPNARSKAGAATRRRH